MLYAVVHVCVMNNILMIIITLHSIEQSSNNISPIYLNKSTDNSSSTRHPNRITTELRTSFQCIDMSSFQIYTYNFTIFYFERLKLGNIIYILYCQYLPKELVQNIHILLLISSNFV